MNLYKLFCAGCLSVLSLSVTEVKAQSTEIVPIVVPDAPDYPDWVSQDLPLWGGKALFPELPDNMVREVYTEKGLIPEKCFRWIDGKEQLTLEISSYKLAERLNAKNEKKLVDGVVQRLAIIHGGYPSLSGGIQDSKGIKIYSLDIKTLKGQAYKAKLYFEGDQVLITSVLMSSADAEVRKQAAYFLDHIVFNPLPGEIQPVISGDKKVNKVKAEEAWETLNTKDFYLQFPRYPVAQHKLVQQDSQRHKYFEWYMGDAERAVTYLLSLTPVELSGQEAFKEVLDKGIASSLGVTEGTELSRKNLDIFRYPGEEVVFKTQQQYFRVRYFCDGQYLYQLLVSGNEGSIYDASANRFLDGLRWR